MDEVRLPTIEIVCPTGRRQFWLGCLAVLGIVVTGLVAYYREAVWRAIETLYLLVVISYSPLSDELPVKLVNTVHAAPWVLGMLVCVLVARGMWQRAGWRGKADPQRWRGTRVTIAPEGLTIQGPDGLPRSLTWHDIARAPLSRPALVVVTRFGETLEFSLFVFRQCTARVGDSPGHLPDPMAVPALAHAYWQAARCGLNRALEEDPRIIMRWLTRDPTETAETRKATRKAMYWLLAGLMCLLGMLVEIGLRTYSPIETLGMVSSVLVVLLGVPALGWWWESRRSPVVWRLRADARGIRSRRGDEDRAFAWAEVKEVGPSVMDTEELLVTVGNRKLPLKLPPLRYANLAALSGADDLTRPEVLRATCQHYLGDAPGSRT